MDIVLLQAAVYITVEILPLPGAQGISEAVYHTAFSGIFTGTSLLVSMCVTRGISFYLNLLIGLIVFGVRMMGGMSKKKSTEQKFDFALYFSFLFCYNQRQFME